MPVVSQPKSEVPPAAAVFGFATRIIEGLLTCTLHCAPAVFPSWVHVRACVAVLVPAGGLVTIVVAEPDGCVVTLNPLLDAVPAEQE